jgi:hypothetical protein
MTRGSLRGTAGLLAAVAVVQHTPNPATAAPADATAPGELRTHATQHSVAIEWDLSGDSNHNAACKVQFRVTGTDTWKPALPLFRVDFHGWYNHTKADRAYNMFAGSVLFLRPGTAYEVTLELSDPDGGAATKTLTLRTRPEPRLPDGGTTYHVIPGDGGGDGSREKPFRGLAAAQQAAAPGDLVLLGPGDYGAFTFDKPGNPGRPIGWKATGPAALTSARVAASHLHIEGLTFKKDQATTALKAVGAVADVALCRCSFTGFHNSVVLSRESRNWHIADNVIEGDNDPAKSILDGEGIDLHLSEGHTVAHNRISRVESGVHYARRDCDIFGNDIFDTSDDGIETDYGYANIRMWGNRVTNYRNNGISFQPMYCGPWYVIRNQVVGTGYAFKFRVQDRFLLAHNTFVTWGLMSDRMHHVLTSLSRNNLYIRAGTSDAPLWAVIRYKDENPEHVRALESRPNWMTDVDYDGFDWGAARVPFQWEKAYQGVASFAAGVGIERHGVRVRKELIFENWDLPEKPGRVGRPLLTLRAGSAAVDAGAVLPNVNDDFAGKAPDLGAHEHGNPPPRYGPRPN